MPFNNDIIRVQTGLFQIGRLPKDIGCIDCTHIKIQSPGGDDSEVYRNRKSYFSINTQMVTDQEMKINDIVARWPGSAHDNTIYNNSRIRACLDVGEFGNVFLGDGGYPLRPNFLTLLINPTTQAEQLYNQAHIRTRNVVERTIGIWKQRFPVLAYGLRCKLTNTYPIIVACAVLHNVAKRMNENEPPLPEHLNEEEFDYLIQQGQIVIPPIGHNNNVVIYDLCRELINNYFPNI